MVLSRRDFNQGKIVTLDKRLLQRRIGRLSERDVRTCSAALDACLGR